MKDVDAGDGDLTELKAVFLAATKFEKLKDLKKLRKNDRGSVNRIGSGLVPHRRTGVYVGLAKHAGC